MHTTTTIPTTPLATTDETCCFTACSLPALPYASDCGYHRCYVCDTLVTVTDSAACSDCTDRLPAGSDAPSALPSQHGASQHAGAPGYYELQFCFRDELPVDGPVDAATYMWLYAETEFIYDAVWVADDADEQSFLAWRQQLRDTADAIWLSQVLK